MHSCADFGESAADRGDILTAARSTCAVLITAAPDDALQIAREIALERGLADRLRVCDFGQEPSPRVAKLIEALPEARILFLREVQDLTPVQQSVLMELMEDGVTSTGMRIIASSSVCLFEYVMRGAFDARLFYRLNAIHVVASEARSAQATAVM